MTKLLEMLVDAGDPPLADPEEEEVLVLVAAAGLAIDAQRIAEDIVQGHHDDKHKGEHGHRHRDVPQWCKSVAQSKTRF